MDHPDEYLAQRGGLHDTRIERFLLDAVRATLVFDVDDLDANFEGLPGYAGPCPARLVFSGVSNFRMDVRDIARVLWILELAAEFTGDHLRATLVLNNGDRMAWDFTGFVVLDIPAADTAIP
jgi:hypothetical protein